MFGIVRNIVIIFLILSVAYALLSFTARVKHRLFLESEWDSQTELFRQTGDKTKFMAEGMRAYARSYRPKLFLGVFIIPSVLIIVLVWLAQNG